MNDDAISFKGSPADVKSGKNKSRTMRCCGLREDVTLVLMWLSHKLA